MDKTLEELGLALPTTNMEIVKIEDVEYIKIEQYGFPLLLKISDLKDEEVDKLKSFFEAPADNEEVE